MKRILTLLLVTFALGACAQIQTAPPTGSKAYGTTTYISPDGLLWYGTNPLKYRGVYPKTKVDSLLALIPVVDTSLFQRRSEKAQANGYASLNASTQVPIAQLQVATDALAGIVSVGAQNYKGAKRFYWAPDNSRSTTIDGNAISFAGTGPPQIGFGTGSTISGNISRIGLDNATQIALANGGVDYLRVASTGVALPQVPVTSAGSYDLLTRNTSTGVVEKIASSSLAGTLQSVTTGTNNNKTTNAVQITGANNYDAAQDGLLMLWDSGGTQMVNIAGGAVDGSLAMSEVGISLQSGSKAFTFNSSETSLISGASFSTRLNILPAILDNDATTLGQVNDLITAIPASNLQNVLTAGNTADQGIKLTATGSIPSNTWLNMYSQTNDGSATGYIRFKNPTSTEFSGLAIEMNQPDNSTLSGTNRFMVDGTESLTLLSPTKGDLIAASFNGKAEGVDATENNQLTTLGQVNTALALKSNIASPTFTGVPAAPTATGGTNTTQIATTAFVQSAISGLGSGTVTSFGKVDGFGITSSVANSTTTPVHTIAVDTTVVRSVLNSYTKAQVGTLLGGYAKLAGTNSFTGGSVQYYFNSSSDIGAVINPEAGLVGVQNGVDTRFTQLQLDGIYFNTHGAVGNSYAVLKSDNLTGSGIVRELQAPNASGTLALTSDFSGYLPLTGGTLVGDLNYEVGNNRAQLSSNYFRVYNILNQKSIVMHQNNGLSINTSGNIASAGFFKTDNLTGDRTYQGPNVSGTLALTADIAAYAASLTTTDATGTPYTTATLNSTYPSAPVRFKVVCTAIGMVYEKYDTGVWYMTNVTILP